jgi:hypothetical protein
MIRERAEDLRKRVDSLEAELKSAKRSLHQMESTCNHVWSDPVSAVRIDKESVPDLTRYTTQGVHLNYETTTREVQRRYSYRVCVNCAKREETTRTEDRVTRVPAF